MNSTPYANKSLSRAAAVRAECARRGIEIERVGKAWHLRGPGVDLQVADLAAVSSANLAPYRPEPDEG